MSRFQKDFWASFMRCVEIAVSLIGSSCLDLCCFDRKAKEKRILFDSASSIYDAYRSNVASDFIVDLYVSDTAGIRPLLNHSLDN